MKINTEYEYSVVPNISHYNYTSNFTLNKNRIKKLKLTEERVPDSKLACDLLIPSRLCTTSSLFIPGNRSHCVARLVHGRNCNYGCSSSAARAIYKLAQSNWRTFDFDAMRTSMLSCSTYMYTKSSRAQLASCSSATFPGCLFFTLFREQIVSGFISLRYLCSFSRS